MLDAIYLTLLTQCSLFDMFYSTLLTQCYCCFCYSLFNVAIVLVIFCLMLLVQCCYSFCCFLFNVIAFLVTPCLMLLFLLLLVWCYYSFCCSLFDIDILRYLLDITKFLVICLQCWFSNTFLLCHVLLLFCSLLFAWCYYSHSSYFGLISLLVFCRCGRSYPNSSF